MVGLVKEDGKPLVRAYSIASPSWHEELEFYSIKVPDGPLTSRLQNIKVGDQVLIGRKPTGTLVLDGLKPGKRLYMLGTGTGLAPWLSLARDPEVYDRFETVVVTHTVREVPTSTTRACSSANCRGRDPLRGDRRQAEVLPDGHPRRVPHQGRITDLITSGQMFADLGLPPFDKDVDRVMLCGGPSVLVDLKQQLLDSATSRARSPRPATSCSNAPSSRPSRSVPCRDRATVSPDPPGAATLGAGEGPGGGDCNASCIASVRAARSLNCRVTPETGSRTVAPVRKPESFASLPDLARTDVPEQRLAVALVARLTVVAAVAGVQREEVARVVVGDRHPVPEEAGIAAAYVRSASQQRLAIELRRDAGGLSLHRRRVGIDPGRERRSVGSQIGRLAHDGVGQAAAGRDLELAQLPGRAQFHLVGAQLVQRVAVGLGGVAPRPLKRSVIVCSAVL
jgi:ferredoxin--NADP+ reductase